MTQSEEHPDRRVHITGCIECGTAFDEVNLGSMSKFLGWKLGGHTARSNRNLYFTLLEDGVRAKFLLSAEDRGTGPKLVSASIRLDVPRSILDKFRCSSCMSSMPLGEATCQARV